MADDAVTGLKRYGLLPNPYLRRRNLDASLCVLAGLQSIQDLKGYIAEAAAESEPAFAMVSGGSGSGRTSVCNHLLATYRDACRLAPEKFVVPRIGVAGDDDFDVLANWRPTYARTRFAP